MHSAAQHEGVFGRAAPCTAPSWSNSNSNSRSWFPVGSRAGSGCGGRCKYVHVSSVAASMRLTPPQPDPPRLRQISAICRSTPCVDESLSDIEINRGQIRFPTENGSDPMTPCRTKINPTVTGKLSKVGRCGLAGPLAPWMAPSSPQGRVYDVSCQPTPPRQATDNPEPLWLWLWLWLWRWLWLLPASGRHYRRCRAQPCRPTLRLRTKTISLISANRHPFATPVPYCAAACAHGRPVLKIARPSLRSIQERHCDGRELGEQQQDVPGHTRGALPPTWRQPQSHFKLDRFKLSVPRHRINPGERERWE